MTHDLECAFRRWAQFYCGNLIRLHGLRPAFLFLGEIDVLQRDGRFASCRTEQAVDDAVKAIYTEFVTAEPDRCG